MNTVLEKTFSERKERVEQVGFSFAEQPKQHIKACNLCENSRLVILTHYDRYGFPVKAMSCLACGLIFQNPVMTRTAYRDFYARFYRPLVSAFHGRLVDVDAVLEEQEEKARHLIDFVEPFFADKGKLSLLDIGGSTGLIEKRLCEQFDFDVTIIDPASPELDRAKSMGFKTIESLLEDYEPSGEQFDFIILYQTIDHLLDIKGSLEKIRTMLAPGGFFFVDFVDFRAACLRTLWIEEVIKVDHPYYLTEATMEAYLMRAGFDVIRKNYTPDPWHIAYLCQQAEPVPQAMPSQESVTWMLREIREIQNPPKPGR